MKNIELFGMVLAMGAVILFCRAFPFLFFSRKNPPEGVAGQGHLQAARRGPGKEAFFDFIEKIVPPVAMTVLAVNALSSSFKENPTDGLLVLGASLLTALVHLWKSNTLLSILGGTVLYMILRRIIL
ncbi:MAG: AzlD domain-containing protein [Treponema sp.]|nr:AzlD domain-containing protein [Treponema sp.]